MKRELLTYIGILVLIIGSIFYTTKNNVVKDIIIEEENVDIIYPYFNEEALDMALEEYIQETLSKCEKKDKLFIDYDYTMDKENIEVSLYQTMIQESNIVREYEEVFSYDKLGKNITTTRSVNASVEYDPFHNRNIDTTKKMVALTFDDGPNYNTKKVIDILNKYQVHATFFVLGENVSYYKNIIKYMQESGMDIGNHTYHHKELTKYKKEVIVEEVTKTNDAIYEVTGSYPHFLRPSYGSVNKKVKETVNMPIVIWNLDTLDWKYHNSTYIVKKIINNVDDGDIILMHSIYSATVNAVDKAIEKLQDLDYEIVSVEELFYYKGISAENGKVYSRAKSS